MSKSKKADVEAKAPYELIEKEIVYVCPNRGKVSEKIKVKVYPTAGSAGVPRF